MDEYLTLPGRAGGQTAHGPAFLPPERLHLPTEGLLDYKGRPYIIQNAYGVALDFLPVEEWKGSPPWLLRLPLLSAAIPSFQPKPR